MKFLKKITGFFGNMLEKLDYRDAIDDMIECGLQPENQSESQPYYPEEKIAPEEDPVPEEKIAPEEEIVYMKVQHSDAPVVAAADQAQETVRQEPLKEPEIETADKPDQPQNQQQSMELIFKDDIVQAAAQPVPPQPKKAVISLLLDTTYSMKEIYCALYRRLMEEITAASGHQEMTLVWRLVSIGHDGYTFLGALTTKELQKKLSEDLVLRGGSFTGYEDITSALKKEYRALLHTEADIRGLLLLTDTLQQSETSAHQPEEPYKAGTSEPDFCMLYVYDKTKFETGISNLKADICNIADFLSGRIKPRLKLKIEMASEGF